MARFTTSDEGWCSTRRVVADLAQVEDPRFLALGSRGRNWDWPDSTAFRWVKYPSRLWVLYTSNLKKAASFSHHGSERRQGREFASIDTLRELGEE